MQGGDVGGGTLEPQLDAGVLALAAASRREMRPDRRLIWSMLSPLADTTAAYAGDVACVDLAPEQGDDVPGRPLLTNPFLVVVGRDGSKTKIEPDLVGAEQQVPEHGAGGVGPAQFHQQPQGQGVVNHRLADIQHRNIVLGQYARELRGDTRPVAAGDVDKDNFAHAVTPHAYG